MPTWSIVYVRASLVYLFLGTAIGALLLGAPGTIGPGWMWTHIELLFSGWFLHVAFGVASWMLPRLWDEPRMGDPRLVWSSFGLLTVGLWIASAGHLVSSGSVLLTAGRVAQFVGCGVFVAYIRPRIRGFGE